MGLFAPDIEIAPDEGFTQDNDLFGRKAFSDTLMKLVKAIDGPGVILLDAPWGSGKSTFVKAWRSELAKENVQSAGVGIAPVGALLGLALPQGILGERESTGPIACKMQIGFTRNQATNVAAYTADVCIDGHSTFEDIWGVTHQTDFYFILDLELKNFVLKYARTAALANQNKPV